MTQEQADYLVENEYVVEAIEMLGAGYNTQQEIIDDSDLRKYRIELPNLYDDADLDPYEFRLLAHYKRVGICTESTKTTALKCKMSPGQVSEKRKSLTEKKFIDMQEVVLKGGGFSYRITVLDRWGENFKKYSGARSLSETSRSPHERPVHSVKQRINNIKKEQNTKKDKNAATPQPPEILIFRDVVKHYPKQNQRETVITAIQKICTRLGRMPTVEDLQGFWTAWGKVSGNEWSLVWLDWAVSGQIGKGNNNAVNITNTQAEQHYTESDYELARLIKQQRLQSAVS